MTRKDLRKLGVHQSLHRLNLTNLEQMATTHARTLAVFLLLFTALCSGARLFALVVSEHADSALVELDPSSGQCVSREAR